MIEKTSTVYHRNRPLVSPKNSSESRRVLSACTHYASRLLIYCRNNFFEVVRGRPTLSSFLMLKNEYIKSVQPLWTLLSGH